MNAEGWTWFVRADRRRRQHYFRDGRSLCGAWVLDGQARLRPFPSVDGAPLCRVCSDRRVAKERRT